VKNLSNIKIKKEVTSTKQNIISSRWLYEKNLQNKPYSTFTIDLNISKNTNTVSGTLCYVTRFGNRIDCFNKFEGTVYKKQVFFNFNSSLGAKNGEAKIIFNDNNINWELLKEPLGEYYIPHTATLTKYKKLR